MCVAMCECSIIQTAMCESVCVNSCECLCVCMVVLVCVCLSWCVCVGDHDCHVTWMGTVDEGMKTL